MSATGANRPVAIASPLGDDVLLFHRMEGREQLGRLFEYQVDVYSEDDSIDFNALLGENVTVRLFRPELGDERYFNGFVSQFHQGTTYEQRYATYQLTLRPWFWFLTRTSDCRIFQEQTVPDIVKQIFSDRGFSDFEERLSGSYRTREYCVQYRETDFDFISRLFEEEGIYYFFKHENGKHTLVMADDYAAHESVGEIPYYPEANVNQREVESVFRWALDARLQPGKVALRDFDFKVPTKDLGSLTPITRSHAQSDYEIYDYPGEYFETADGDHYSRVRIEELQAQHETPSGQSDARTLSTGALFTLTKHTRADQNREYLITGTDYTLVSDEYESGHGAGEAPLYDCRFTVIVSQQPFRPARITPRPLIRGPQTALVVGPSGEEIHTDEHGRIKCQFHWDRYSAADDTSSCWIRVSQGWAGKNWGMFSLPRIGQEVIVEFLEGNPDDPIVTGRVYNGDNKPPYELPGEKTKSTLKSNSSKGGGGFNEIRFEDLKDSEQIFVHAQKNMDNRVLNDSKEWIGNDRHLIIKNDRFEKIENHTHLTVDVDQYEKVGGDKHQEVVGDHNGKVSGSRSLDVAQDIDVKAGSNYALDAGSDIHLKAGMNMVIEAGMKITLKVGGNFITIDQTGVSIKGTMVRINSGGSAGSGSGSSPTAPTAPTDPLEADTAEAGGIASASPPPPPDKPPQSLTSTTAQAMQQASDSGAALVGGGGGSSTQSSASSGASPSQQSTDSTQSTAPSTNADDETDLDDQR